MRGGAVPTPPGQVDVLVDFLPGAAPPYQAGGSRPHATSFNEAMGNTGNKATGRPLPDTRSCYFEGFFGDYAVVDMKKAHLGMARVHQGYQGVAHVRPELGRTTGDANVRI